MKIEFLGLTREKGKEKLEWKLSEYWRQVKQGLLTHENAYESIMEMEKIVSDIIITTKEPLYLDNREIYQEWDNLLWYVRSMCSEYMDAIVRDFERKRGDRK